MAWRTSNGNNEMPFLDHLEELRQRLFYCAIAVVLGGGVAFALFQLVPDFDLIGFLSQPATQYLRPGQKLMTTEPTEAFNITMNLGILVALVVASPVIIYQIWQFVAPAMHPHEKRIAIPTIVGMVVLFVSGVVFAFHYVLPPSMEFLVGFGGKSLDTMLTAKAYFSFATFLCVGFGAICELPIVIAALTALGLIRPNHLTKFRRFAMVGALIGAASVTPDPLSMFYTSIPLYGLYELSIVLSRFVYRWRVRHEERQAASDIPPPGTDDGPRRLGVPV